MNARPTIIHFQQLHGEWEKLKAACTTAKDRDTQECEAGKEMASWHDCKDFDSLMEYKTEYTGNLDTLVTDLDQKIADFASKDVAQGLLDKRDNWSKLHTTVVELRKDVDDHQRLDVWEGEAAQSYKKLLPTQMAALTELAGLATSQGTACDQLSLINAYMFVNTNDALIEAESKLRNMPGPDINWADEKIGGSKFDSYRYLRRTANAIDYLTSIIDWLRNQQAISSADWSGAATSLDTDLTSITGNTVNLQQNGQWPGIGVVVGSGAANTSDAGSGNDVDVNEANVNDTGTSVGW